MARRKLEPLPEDPAAALAESRRLSGKLEETRRDWDAGRGKNYGHALDYIISKRRRDLLVAQLRGGFTLAVDNTAPLGDVTCGS